MKKRIVIDLNDLSSFDKAIKEITKFEKWVNQKTNELIKRLADEGVNIALSHTERASAYGNTDIEIYSEKGSNGSWRIVASGEDVYFVEFGAGIGVDESDPFVAQADVEVFDGSYSLKHNGPYIKTGIWHYNGLTLNGIEALKPMYQTQKELEERLVDIAKEVFSQ